jgi:hypothetical protein
MGTGLGLDLQQIARTHGGNITPRNRRNGGATFRVSLPAIGREEPAGGGESVEEALDPRRGRRTVDPLLPLSAHDEGYEVETAETVARGGGGPRPDVVIWTWAPGRERLTHRAQPDPDQDHPEHAYGDSAAVEAMKAAYISQETPELAELLLAVR